MGGVGELALSDALSCDTLPLETGGWSMQKLTRAFFVVLAVGCGATPPPVVAPPTSVAIDHGRWPARLPPPTDEPWRTMTFENAGGYRVLAHEGDADLVLALGSRLRVTSSSVEAARDGTALDLLAPTRIDGVWTFAYQGGSILQADGDFLGPLRGVASVPTTIIDAAAGDGVMTLRFDRVHVHRFGHDGLAMITVPGVPNAAVISAVALNATTTAAVVAPGELRYSTDGTTFDVVDLGGRVPVSVELLDDGHLSVETLAGWLELDGTTVVATTDHAPGHSDPQLPRDLFLRLIDDEARRQPFNGATVIAPSGRVYRSIDDDGSAFVWDPQRGPVHVRAPSTESCGYDQLGEALLAVCGDRPAHVFISDDLASFTELGAYWPASDEGWWYANDGSSFAAPGRCDPASLAPSPNANGDASDPPDEDALRDEHYVCWHDGVHMRERRLPNHATLVDVWREHLLIRIRYLSDQGDDEEVGALLELDSDAEPVPVALPADLRWIDLERPQFTGDGLIVATTSSGDENVLVVGPMEGQLVSFPLPEGTVSAGLADAMHGVAMGATYAQVFVTVDGGVTWTPTPMPWTGDPGSYPSAAEVACSPGGCSVTGVLAYAPARLIARATASPDSSLLFPTLQQGAEGDTLPPHVVRACTTVDATSDPRVRAPGGAIWRAVQRSGSPTIHVTGVDARGAFAWDATAPDDHGAVYAATRSIALYQTPAYSAGGTLSVLRASGPPIALTIDALAHGVSLDANGPPAMTLPDGSIAAALFVAPGGGFARRVLVVHVRANGTLADATLHALPAASRTHLAALASGEVGMVGRYDGEVYFHGPRSHMLHLGAWSETPPFCGRARVTARIQSTNDSRLDVTIDGAAQGGDDVTLAITARGLCIESVRSGFVPTTFAIAHAADVQVYRVDEADHVTTTMCATPPTSSDD
jgi:hypothetical protein